MPVTEKGFERLTYDEILAAKILKAKELFGEDIDTTELTPLGKFIRINAYDQAMTEEEAEHIYYSIFPTTAQGQSLDRLCWMVGISRNAASPSVYSVSVTGEPGTVVPVGFLVATDAEMTFYTVQETTVGDDGTCVVEVACTQPGLVGNIDPADIVRIVNPVANINSVVGVARIEVGEDVESDYSLRRRYDLAKDGLGSCNTVAIKSALLRIPTVDSVGIAENATDEVDSEGRPPRSFECYISGGDEYEQLIAETIFDKKPIGILTFGDITRNVKDDGGFEHSISFSHTEDIGVYVRITISTSPDFVGAEANKEIRNYIQEHINQIGVGEPVVFSALFGLIFKVTGVTDVSEIKLSTDEETWLAKNVVVSQYQNCVFRGLRVRNNEESEYEVIP